MRRNKQYQNNFFIFLQKNIWLITGLFWIAGLLLGYLGVSQYSPASPTSDKLYFSLQLIVLESGSIQNPPVLLDIARYLLPILAAQTGLIALANILVRQTKQIGLYFSRSHIIVCGDGPLGEFVSKLLLDNNIRIAFLSPDPNYFPRALEEAGAVVLSGRIEDPHIQSKLNIHKATHLLSFCEQDITNINIAFTLCRANLKRRKFLLPSIIHSGQRILGSLFIEKAYRENLNAEIEFDVINIYDLSAQIFTRKIDPEKTKKIVCIGFDEIMEKILLEIANKLHLGSAGKVEVFISGVDSKNIIKNLLSNFREFEKRYIFKELDLDDFDALIVGWRVEDPNNDHKNVLYLIRLSDTPSSLSIAITAAKSDPNGKVFILVDRVGALSELIAGEDRDLSFFGIYDEINHPEYLLNSKTEQLAQSFHRHYIECEKDSEKVGEPDWGELPELMKESNRRLAQSIRSYLLQLGYALVPQLGVNDGQLLFSEAETRFIAQKEHERWMTEKKAQGWRFGISKDDYRKTNPYLKSWNDLSENEREFNFEFVSIIPEVIGKARLQVIPLESRKSD